MSTNDMNTDYSCSSVSSKSSNDSSELIDRDSLYDHLRQLFDICAVDSRTVEVSVLINHLVDIEKNSEYETELLKDMFECFCENNGIDKNRVDYITFMIVLFTWVQKLLNYPVVTATAKASVSNNDITSANLINFIKAKDRSESSADCSKISVNEDDETIQKLEYENKRLVEYTQTLKQQLEKDDDSITILNNELDLKIKENESLKKYLDLNMRLENENQDLKELALNLEKRVKTHEKSLYECELEKKSLESSLDSVSQQLHDLNRKLDNMNEQKAKLEYNLKEQTENANKYEELSVYFEAKYNETNVKLDKLAVLAQKLNESSECFQEENLNLKSKLQEAHFNLTCRSNLDYINNNQASTTTKHTLQRINTFPPITQSRLTSSLSFNNFENTDCYFDDVLDLNNNDVTNHDLTTDLIDLQKEVIESPSERNNIFNEIKQVYLNEQKSEHLATNEDNAVIECLEIEYEQFLNETKKYNLNEDCLKFTSYIESFVQILFKYKNLFERVAFLYEHCKTITYENQNLQFENELLLKKEVTSVSVKELSRFRKYYSMQNLSTRNAVEVEAISNTLQHDDGTDNNRVFDLESSLSNILGDNYDIEIMEDDTSSFNSSTISNGTFYTLNNDETTSGFNQSLVSKASFKISGGRIIVDYPEENDVKSKNTIEAYTQTVSACKLRRSLSVPNLRNYYLNAVKCEYCRCVTNQTQSTQTDSDDEQQSLNCSNELRVPRAQRGNLRTQLTKDSGIDIHMKENNNKSSKTNSYSSTPTDLCDPGDLIAIVSTSTRNNSLDRHDSVNNLNEPSARTMNETPENFVLEKSLKSLEQEFAKYNMFHETPSAAATPDTDNQSKENAVSKRRLFKESHRKHNTVAVTNYDSNLATIIDDKEFKRHFDTQRNSIDGSNPTIRHTALSKAAYKLHFEDEGSQLIDSSRSSSMMSIDGANQILVPPSAHGKVVDEDHSGQNLRSLETLFNEIAMAHYSDQKTLENCISIYQEKYHKADYMMNLLFNNLNTTLHKTLQLVNDENNEKTTDTTLKKKLQENLSNMNNTVKYLKQNLSPLIYSSSTISGLKQEMHLGELVQITISYTRELRKSFMKPFARRLKTSRSEKRNSQSSSNPNEHATSSTPACKLTDSICKPIASCPTIKRANELCNSETDDSIFENTTRHAALTTLDLSAQSTPITPPLAKSDTPSPSSSKTTQLNPTLNARIRRAVSYNTLKTTAQASYSYLRQNIEFSLTLVRRVFSIILFTISILLFLLTLFQDRDIFQQVIHFFVDSVEITNSNNGRPL